MKILFRLVLRVLPEELMGFLALVALSCALTPLFFTVSPGWAAVLNTIQWLVVALFTIEYVSGFALAKSKSAFALTPLHLLVAVTVVVALASLLESVPDSFVAAPALRLLHVVAAAIFGVQAGAITLERRAAREADPSPARKEVYALDPEGRMREVSWMQLLEWCEERTTSWYHAENLQTTDLPDIASRWGISLPLLQVCLGEQNYPRVEFFGSTILLSVWLRNDPQSQTPSAPVVLLVHGEAVLSITRSDTDLQSKVGSRESEFLSPNMSFTLRMLISILEIAIHSAEIRIDACESQLRAMERNPMGKARPTLFAEAYTIKQELSGLYSDLWRLRGAITRLEGGKVRLSESNTPFERLARHTEFLYTTVDNLRESIISLIELHMNSASFEMTRFMRLLAVVNVLALIPAVAGGLLGMNISGAPWPLTLGQVTFLTALANIFCLYYFAVKGWMR